MIQDGNIRLRAVEPGDLPDFQRWLNDEEVTAGLMLCLPLSMADEQSWYESILITPPAEHPLVIEYQTESGWKAIGNCGLHRIETRCRLGEVGIFIGEKDYWDKGVGTRVLRLLVRHAFNTLNLNRVFLQVYATNLRAIHCYEQVGFVHEGRLRQNMYKNGKYIDVLIMGIIRSEWETAHIND
jgi:RimJ/RimL family protein N-acetyltransferase